MKEYDHKKIETKWQKKWAADELYKTPDKVKGKENFYTLVEFPYPSGNLHLGHWYAFAVPDIYARFQRMTGKNVLFPMGFDAFGLPAENAAIKHNLDPRKWTDQNIEYMTRQLERMGASFDWARSLRTTDPDYYRWTQFFFTKFFENNLAYQKEATVNWCSSCQTVLANEQVINGECERCDTEVTQKEMKQWFLRISDYADRLADDLDNLDWPEPIKVAQKSWVGRQEGTQFSFQVTAETGEFADLEVFTTRPDTLYGVTYLAVAPEHELVSQLLAAEGPVKSSSKDADANGVFNGVKIKNYDKVEMYVAQAEAKTERERQENKEKTGVKLEGVVAVHPATGAEIPIFVADYVLSGYGTGAIMAVPAHDKRDFAFAEKYNITITPVVEGDADDKVFTGQGTIINSGKFDGLPSAAAAEKITKKFGQKETTYRLRDWSVGRQRYWGTPIPIVYDPDGKPHAVPEEYLPWELPDDVDHTPSGEPPLASSKKLKERTEKIFGTGWTPEVETMDTFIDSSWYFLRYIDPDNSEDFASQSARDTWMPVDFYSGGAEHTTMHLLYARFFYKALADLGFVDGEEPFKRRMNRGLILGPDGNKMSKSKGNVIDPDDQVEKVGGDSVRAYLAFIGPYNEEGTYPWDMGGIAGVRRFLERAWAMQSNLVDEPDESIEQKLHQTIKSVTEDTKALKFNTALSAMMEYVNEAKRKTTKEQFRVFLRLLAPFAPHITEELWHELGGEGSVHQQAWPEYDEKALVVEEVTIAVQVNGTVRGEIKISAKADEKEILAAAREEENVAKYLESNPEIRHIYVPSRLVNFVTRK
ncbi:MAG: leucine--tRNA ligase [Candidatus Paceibacterota bacterium]